MANPWLGRGCFHWAHQGGAREGPSNTVLAMRRGMAAGADGIELDVHLSGDGTVVVCHDGRLGRLTDRTGVVARLPDAELRAADAAYWWTPGRVDDHRPDTPASAYELRHQADDPPVATIPTLDEMLEAFPDIPLTVEVKAKAATLPLAATLRRRRPGEVIVTSMHDSVVRRLRRVAPDLGLAPGRIGNLWFWLRSRVGLAPRSSPYVALQVPHRWKFLRFADRRLVTAAHRAGLAVHVWTIDDPAEMRQLLDLGVDGIMTDSPSVLAGVLGEAR